MDFTTLAATATSFPSLATLSLLSFTESSCFIIPPEVLLIPAALAAPTYAIWLGLLTTVTSVIGAQFGYWIGSKGGKPLLKKYFKEENVDKVKTLFHQYDAWAILVAAFTPIPFKLATISAGVFDIDYRRFTLATIVGRGSRYMLIATLLFLYGEPVQDFIEHDLNRFMGIGTLALIAVLVLIKWGKPALAKLIIKTDPISKLKKLFSRYR